MNIVVSGRERFSVTEVTSHLDRNTSTMVVKWVCVNDGKWHFKRILITEIVRMKKTDAPMLLVPVVVSSCYSPKLPCKITHFALLVSHTSSGFWCTQCGHKRQDIELSMTRKWSQNFTLKAQFCPNVMLNKAWQLGFLEQKLNTDLVHMFVCEIRDHRYQRDLSKAAFTWDKY